MVAAPSSQPAAARCTGCPAADSQAELARLRQEVASLTRQVATYKEQERCTRSWLLNTRVPWQVRLIGLASLWQAGATPGNPSSQRPSEWVRSSHAAIGRTVGVSEKTVDRYWPVIEEMELVRARTRKEWSADGGGGERHLDRARRRATAQRSARPVAQHHANGPS